MLHGRRRTPCTPPRALLIAGCCAGLLIATTGLPVPGTAGLWVASGCNGSGFSSSPALGDALASWIQSGSPPDGMAALAPARFAAMTDDVLIERGIWQYAHYYDPMAADQT